MDINNDNDKYTDATDEYLKDGPSECKMHDRNNSSDKNYSIINAKVAELINKGIVSKNIGEAKKPVPVKIADVNRHALKHGVSLKEAQEFVDNSVVMFDQGNRTLFISKEGNSVILDKEKRLISAYRRDDFNTGVLAILEVVDNE